MRKYKSIILQITIFTFVFYGLSFAQSNKNSILPQTLNEKDLDLKTALVKKRVSVREKIELKILFRNNFSSTVVLLFMNYDLFGGYKIEIADFKGKIIKPVKDPEENHGYGSQLPREVNAKEEDERVLILSNFYELPPGKYSITVNRKVNNAKKLESVLVKSNSVDLTVVK